ncbi:MAG: CTP-dependent riboflavin kinase [Candidatus Tectomicrobia bacterium]|nr:CTP-dependent riboflavin kinase [Candidatus Tectomicrobia bacterium]
MNSVRLRGRLFKGLGEGARFTRLSWAKAAFARILGFEPFPGTVNLRVDPAEAGDALRRIRGAEGIPMSPPDESGFCAARCFRGRLGDKLAAGLVIPEVEGYYEDVLEILAPVNVRETLGVSEGDVLEVEIFLSQGEGRP